MLLKNILEGWGNWALREFKLLDPQIVQMSKLRLLICDVCDMRTGQICNPSKQGINIETKQLTNGCGCVIPPKTLSPYSECPLGKWKKYEY